MSKEVHRVYNEIQVPTDQSLKHGTIIYANSYSGYSPVDMPPEFKQALNSDAGEVGNNILIQLEQKILGFPNGPWYLDSRDGVIYIHNKKFQEDPVYNYKYKAENGELISIDFQTRYTTKSLRGSVTSGITQEKDFVIDVHTDHYEDFLVDNDATEKERKEASGKAYNAYCNGTLSYEQFIKVLQDNQYYQRSNGDKTLYAIYGEAEHQRRLKEKEQRELQSRREEIQRIYQEYQAHGGKKGGGDEYLRQQYIDNMLKDPNTVNLKDEVERMLIGITHGEAGGIQRVMHEMKAAAERGELDEYIKHLVGNSIHVFDNPAYDTNPCTYTEKVVDCRSYSTLRKKSYSKVGRGKKFDKEYEMKRAKDGFTRLLKDPTIMVISTSPYSKENGFRIIIFAKEENTTTSIPQYRLLYAYYTRRFGTNGSTAELERRIREAGNSNRRITERKLTCKLNCIGNPKLTSSDIINIANVGSKWSGNWYIKSCIHQMNSQSGYTCLVELVKHKHSNPIDSTSSNLNTTHISASAAKSHGSTSKGKNTSGVGSEYYSLPTTEEMAYYEGLKTYQEKIEFIIKKFVANEQSAYYRKYGIVKALTDTSTNLSTTSKWRVANIKVTNEDRKKYARAARKFMDEMSKGEK